jgi:filamentous hemagglutinin
LNVKNLAGFADNEAGLAGSSMRTVEPGRFSSSIENSLNSNIDGYVLEGQIGKALDERGLLLNFQSKIRSGFTANGRPIGLGEIDAETPRYIIESKAGKNFDLKELLKLKNNTLLNPERKPVVVFAPKFTPNQIKTINSNGIVVVQNFDQLLKLKL